MLIGTVLRSEMTTQLAVKSATASDPIVMIAERNALLPIRAFVTSNTNPSGGKLNDMIVDMIAPGPVFFGVDSARSRSLA